MNKILKNSGEEYKLYSEEIQDQFMNVLISIYGKFLTMEKYLIYKDLHKKIDLGILDEHEISNMMNPSEMYEINVFMGLIKDEKYPKNKRYGGVNSQILSVTAYSIESVVDFVEKTYAKYPKSLFIITGDHFDRIHPSPVRDIYTSTSIPLIMYGYGVKDIKLKYAAASHKDIVPTIIEMNAPLGFKYNSLC